MYSSYPLNDVFNSCDKEVQRVRWGWNSQENDIQGGQNAKNA